MYSATPAWLSPLWSAFAPAGERARCWAKGHAAKDQLPRPESDVWKVTEGGSIDDTDADLPCDWPEVLVLFLALYGLLTPLTMTTQCSKLGRQMFTQTVLIETDS